MVRGVGQRVAPGGLDELFRLAADPALTGPEHEEQDEGGHQPGRQRNDDHVLPDEPERCADRVAVAPQADDGEHLAVLLEREVLTQERRRSKKRPERLRRSRLDERRGRDAGHGLGEVLAPGGRRAGDAVLVRGDDRAVRPADLDPGDTTLRAQVVERLLELRGERVGRGLGIEVGDFQRLVGDCPDRRRVASDDRLQDRLAVRRGDEDRLCQRGDPDDHQEHAKHQQEQDRLAWMGEGPEHSRTPPSRANGSRSSLRSWTQVSPPAVGTVPARPEWARWRRGAARAAWVDQPRTRGRRRPEDGGSAGSAGRSPIGGRASSSTLGRTEPDGRGGTRRIGPGPSPIVGRASDQLRTGLPISRATVPTMSDAMTTTIPTPMNVCGVPFATSRPVIRLRYSIGPG